jgi:hypothetical protein
MKVPQCQAIRTLPVMFIQKLLSSNVDQISVTSNLLVVSLGIRKRMMEWYFRVVPDSLLAYYSLLTV